MSGSYEGMYFSCTSLILIRSAVMYHIILKSRMSADPQHNLSPFCVLPLIPLSSNFGCRSSECIIVVSWMMVTLSGMR